VYIYICKYVRGKKMERKKGKKSVRDLFFKLHFAWKKRELCDVHGGGGSSPPDLAAPRPTVVWQCLFFSFSYFSCSLSARGNYTHRRYTTPPPPHTLTIRNIHHHHPLHHHHSLPTLMSRPLTRAYCCTVYFGNNANGDCGATGSGGGGDSFLKVSFWFWRWQIHTVLSSVVCRHPHTLIHEHSAFTNTIASYTRPYIYIYVCVYVCMCECVCARAQVTWLEPGLLRLSEVRQHRPHTHTQWLYSKWPARLFFFKAIYQSS